jgi:cadmium resistance protein CadD (predicted permease)
MESIFSILGLAVVVFASTNVDDFLILIAFFSDPKISRSTVVIGQLIGIGILTGISVLAAHLAVQIPEDWTALLGLVPLILGIQKLFAQRKVQTTALSSMPGGDWTTIGGILSVILVTIANGGDNLAVTIPLFASQASAVWIYVVVFTVMTAIWCVAGFYLTRHLVIATHLDRYGRLILPFVLIILGLYVLSRGWFRF